MKKQTKRFLSMAMSAVLAISVTSESPLMSKRARADEPAKESEHIQYEGDVAWEPVDNACVINIYDSSAKEAMEENQNSSSQNTNENGSSEEGEPDDPNSSGEEKTEQNGSGTSLQPSEIAKFPAELKDLTATKLEVSFQITNVEKALRAVAKDSADAYMETDAFGSIDGENVIADTESITKDGTYTVSIYKKNEDPVTLNEKNVHFISVKLHTFDSLFYQEPAGHQSTNQTENTAEEESENEEKEEKEEKEDALPDISNVRIKVIDMTKPGLLSPSATPTTSSAVSPKPGGVYIPGNNSGATGQPVSSSESPSASPVSASPSPAGSAGPTTHPSVIPSAGPVVQPTNDPAAVITTAQPVTVATAKPTAKPAASKAKAYKKGDKFSQGSFTFRVDRTAGKNRVGKVAVVDITKTGKKKMKLSIPAYATAAKKYGGYKYKIFRINGKALKNVKKKSIVKIGDTVTELEASAFQGAKMKSLVLGKKINKVPKKCFADCTYLEVLGFKFKLKSVEKGAFAGCKKSIKVMGRFKQSNLNLLLEKSGYKKFKG